MHAFSIILSALVAAAAIPSTLASPCKTHHHKVHARSYISRGQILTEAIPDQIHDVQYGVPVQYRTENKKALTSILVFEFPTASAEWAQKKCQMHFDDPVLAVGSRQAGVYLLSSADVKGSTWNDRKGVTRSQLLGFFEVEEMKKAKWYVGWQGTVPCPTKPGQEIALELVPVGEYVALEWMAKQKGLRIEVRDW